MFKERYVGGLISRRAELLKQERNRMAFRAIPGTLKLFTLGRSGFECHFATVSRGDHTLIVDHLRSAGAANRHKIADEQPLTDRLVEELKSRQQVVKPKRIAKHHRDTTNLIMANWDLMTALLKSSADDLTAGRPCFSEVLLNKRRKADIIGIGQNNSVYIIEVSSKHKIRQVREYLPPVRSLISSVLNGDGGKINVRMCTAAYSKEAKRVEIKVF